MITAKSIVQSRRAKNQMYVARATMNTMSMQLANQASMLKVKRVPQQEPHARGQKGAPCHGGGRVEALCSGACEIG